MKYVDEFRDGALAQNLTDSIALQAQQSRTYRLMEFCGGHTHALSRYGLLGILPANVQMIHGPGCPVCVLPIGRVDLAIRLAMEKDVILCSYGDCLRVPASDQMSLLKAKARGGDVRMVYSALDALKIAMNNPARQVVFFAIGFETTTPPTASIIRQARANGLTNFSVLCNHVLTLPAMEAILTQPGGVPLQGLVGPAHVSTVIGSQPYQYIAKRFNKPIVISGFEPLDLLQGILMLLRQVNENRAEVENEFTRAVTLAGNRKAQALVDEVFEVRDSFEWRGLGSLPFSGLKIRVAFAEFDAELRYPDLIYTNVPDHKACECGAILRGEKRPQDCKIFGTICTPDNPIGSCMVSSEGACAAHYTYGRFSEVKWAL
ncbi:MAG: hydrogenase formation protein HypD [Sulfuritalea sp.]|jgi:hydrogenase expression/formation protein HypD|nr:hydrogenase formation protein HypD [Sulfuritalea sp.]